MLHFQNDEINRAFAKELVQIMKTNKKINQLPYSNEFRQFWKEKLFFYSRHNFKFIQNSISEQDQIFDYCFTLLGKEFHFDFNIKYITGFFNYDKLYKTDVISKKTLHYKNSKLTCEDLLCEFTAIPIEDLESNYNQMDEIFIVKIPTDLPHMLVIDGNHRLCHQIKMGKNNIKVNYINETVAAQSLVDAFQTCVYCFLSDLNKITTANRINSNLKSNLNIYSLNSPLATIEKRAKSV